MNKKIILLTVIAVLVLALVIGLILILGGQGNGKGAAAPSGSVIQTTPSDPTADPSTDPTTDPTSPIQGGAVQDSIFDDDTQQATQTTVPTAGNTGTDSPVPPTVDTVPPSAMTYEKYHAMSPRDQRLYMESFGDVEAFFQWYNAAKEQYEKDHPAIDIGDGTVDLSKLPGATP